MRRAVVLGLALLAIGCAGATPRPTLSPGTPEPVATVLNAMPAANARAEAELAAELLAAGPEALRLVCSLVGIPGTGNDILARYALGSVAHAAAAPGNDGHHALLENVLLGSLDVHALPAARLFFLELLQLVGTDTSVPALGDLIPDEDLGSPAMAALTAIGSPAAAAVLRASLADLQSPLRWQAVLALGRLRDEKAVPTLVEDLRGSRSADRLVAMRALAEIGAPDVAEAMLRAASRFSGYEETRALNHLLRYAESLHARGESALAEEVAGGLQASDNAGVRHAAELLLARIGVAARSYRDLLQGPSGATAQCLVAESVSGLPLIQMRRTSEVIISPSGTATTSL